MTNLMIICYHVVCYVDTNVDSVPIVFRLQYLDSNTSSLADHVRRREFHTGLCCGKVKERDH